MAKVELAAQMVIEEASANKQTIKKINLKCIVLPSINSSHILYGYNHKKSDQNEFWNNTMMEGLISGVHGDVRDEKLVPKLENVGFC